MAASAQTFTVVSGFFVTSGLNPVESLVQGLDGYLYGVAAGGGATGGRFCFNGSAGCGTVFKITPAGDLKTLHTFCQTQLFCPDGATPSGLVLATDGNFYGTTAEGGAAGNCRQPKGCGTIFKISSGGTFTSLYSFCSQLDCSDGFGTPLMIQGLDGSFYGTNQLGGQYDNGGCSAGCGTVFKFAGGTLTTLFTFAPATCAKYGCLPDTRLIQGTDGNFYGTNCNSICDNTEANNTIFKVTPTGTVAKVHLFTSMQGFPLNGLMQAADGNIYGTSAADGASGGGTVFKMTLSPAVTTLYNFCSSAPCNSNGSFPEAGLVQGTDEDFYGTTSAGGTNSGCGSSSGCGTIFKITATGALTSLYSFCGQSGCTDGFQPQAPLIQATDGNFYGTTTFGGPNTFCASNGAPKGCGEVFSLSVGLGPFVKTLPWGGAVGTIVRIMGTDLTGASEVTFNGTKARFIFVSKWQLKATVPVGATTGTVAVTTPGGILNSNTLFQVLP